MSYQITSTTPAPTLNFHREDYHNEQSMARKRKRRSLYDIVYEKAAQRVEAYLSAIDEELENETGDNTQS